MALCIWQLFWTFLSVPFMHFEQQMPKSVGTYVAT